MAGIDGINTVQDNYEKYKDMFSDKENDLITMDSFYQLLVAEMQNQDPLEPTSNTEFISQMASFTSLQAQQDNFKTQQQNYANSLVGKTVTVATMSGELITGTVNYATVGDNPQVNVNGSNYSLSAIKQMHTGNTAANGISDYGAFATGLLGKTVMVRAVDVDGTTFIDQGTVSSLEIQDGELRLVINGFAYKPSDVVRVTETEQQKTEPVQEEEEAEEVQDKNVIKTDEEDIEDIVDTEDITDKEAVENTEETELLELFD